MTGLPPVRKSVVVPLERAAAFELFTRRLGEWWPLTHRSATKDAVYCTVEPYVGGRLFERTRFGTESVWGVYLVFEEPSRVVFTWHPGATEETATEVEVTFSAIERGTRVDVEHRHWERLGARASFVRELFDGGWVGVLERFVARAEGVSPQPWVDTPGCIDKT
jgi:uncharacterized protein YndB with AHSA1/START domain